jgi:pyruvate formate lyase activating enzyme
MIRKRLVLNITRMTVHNGPGLRTLIVFKGCPLRCLWCSTPESQERQPEIGISRKKCNMCGKCIDACPLNAVSISDKVIKIDREKCNRCGICVEACHPEAIQIYGKYMTVTQLVKEAEKDIVFYKNSGGGVTISGGEPLIDPEFNEELLSSLKRVGINVGIDTSGYVPWSNIERLLPFIDFLLWDIKHMDSEKHRTLTGVPNELILSNARACSEKRIPLYIRIPVIPGFNDTEENISETCVFAKELASLVQIDLLPVHHLGRARYESLDRPYPLSNVPLIQDDTMQRLKELVESYGLKCTIGG